MLARTPIDQEYNKKHAFGVRLLNITVENKRTDRMVSGVVRMKKNIEEGMCNTFIKICASKHKKANQNPEALLGDKST